jgi:biopolymer transport protein ExbD
MAFASFDRKTSSGPMAEINMVPLIDVVLVLLVIFIVTAPLMTNSVKLDLPKATSQPDIQKPEKIEFAIDPTGNLFWNGERISREDAEAKFLEEG